MVRRYHRSIYDELDELKASMDYLFQLALDPTENPLLPAEEKTAIVCQYAHTLNAEVSETDEEVMVTVDLICGMYPQKLSVELVRTDAVRITCVRQEEEPADINRINPGEQIIFPVPSHLAPVPVTITGACSTLKNGVLDLHLKKAAS